MIWKHFSRMFRFSNARLIYTDNILLEKLLKLILLFSTLVYRKQRQSIKTKKILLIDNFDSTIKMEVDIARSMGAAIYWTGFHEFRELIFLHRYLRPEMVFVDIGANQGEYSLFACKRLTKGKVLAFEPLPSILNMFKKNIDLNHFHNIDIFEFGLSDKEEELKIHEIMSAHEGLATFYPGDQVISKEYVVHLKPLDEIFEKSNNTRLDFIKVDIEGGELKALKGGRNTIEKYRPVVMVEINDDTYRAAGYSSSEVANFFSEIHYKPFTIGKRGKLNACTTLPSFGNVLFKYQV